MSDSKLPRGSRRCLCRGCGEYFSAPSTFDLHRAGEPAARYCRTPSEITDKLGRQLLRQDEEGFWRYAKAHPRTEQEAA